MMKNLLKIIGVVGLLSACVWGERDYSRYLCPQVRIWPENAATVQLVGYSEEVKIEIIGYDGYCMKTNNIDRRFARIMPLFRVERLTKGSGDTRFDFSYIARTIQGPPEFLGWKKHFVSVHLPLEQTQKEFYGKEISVRLPNEGYDDFTILLEMTDAIPESQIPQMQIFTPPHSPTEKRSGCGCGI